MFKRLCTAFISLVVLVSFYYSDLPSKAFTDEDAYNYSAQAISDAMKNKEKVIDISAYLLPASYAEQIYYYVILSDPSLYYVKLNYTDSTCTLSEDGQYVDSYTVEYYLEDTSDMDKIFEEHVEKAVSEIPVTGMHTVDQMLAIHEYIANNVDKTSSLETITDDMLCSTAYGALVYGCADSLGYALLNMLLAEKITGNECIVVSDAEKSLYWNMYNLNGNWYNIDVYSDDTESFYVTADQSVTDAYTLGSVRNHIYFLEINESLSMYGHSAPVAYIFEGTPASETDSVRIRIWNNIVSPMFYHDGYWHYVSPSNPDVIVKRLTNIVSTASYENTVFEADGVLISFSMTDDSYYYLTENKTITRLTFETMESAIVYSSESDTEFLIGLGNRDDRVYYETYNSSDSSYSYNLIGTVYTDTRTPAIENSIFTGVYCNAKVKDISEALSKTGVVSRYGAYNSITVSSGDTAVSSLYSAVATDMILKLDDGNEYKIVVYGDVVPTGNINILDIMTTINYVIGSNTSMTETQILAADFDGTEGVNIADVSAMYTAMMY
ncbi:MAG: hypothetical protein IJZ94_03895 [Clostridia bacterium]|nr:hypothetical protein [Clostridia bacterium]